MKKVLKISLIVASLFGLVLFNFKNQLLSDSFSLIDFLTIRFENFLGLINFDWTYLLIDFGLITSVLGIELIIVGWKKSSLEKLFHPNKSSLTDWLFGLVALSGTFRFLAVLSTFGITYFAYGTISKSVQLNLAEHINSPVIRFIIVSFFSGLFAYWLHRLSHQFKWWWSMHKFHHSANSLNVITYYRIHFLEKALNMYFEVLPFIVFGAGVDSFILYYVIVEGHNLIIHSKIESNWGWFGKYIMISPKAHIIHHSTNPKHYNKNFSNTFSFYDRMFSTFEFDENVEAVGVDSNEYNKDGLMADLIRPYKDLFNSL